MWTCDFSTIPLSPLLSRRHEPPFASDAAASWNDRLLGEPRGLCRMSSLPPQTCCLFLWAHEILCINLLCTRENPCLRLTDLDDFANKTGPFRSTLLGVALARRRHVSCGAQPSSGAACATKSPFVFCAMVYWQLGLQLVHIMCSLATSCGPSPLVTYGHFWPGVLPGSLLQWVWNGRLCGLLTHPSLQYGP